MKLILSDKPLYIDLQDSDKIKYMDLSSMKIANCVGCFGCWTKTPGCCVIRDDATKVYPLIAKSDSVLYISRLKYGGYDTIMKTMLERAIPIQQAFNRIYKGETYHVQRAVKPKNAIIIPYGDISDEEKEIFKLLVARNSKNMNFDNYRIIFATEKNLYSIVNTVLRKWSE